MLGVLLQHRHVVVGWSPWQSWRAFDGCRPRAVAAAALGWGGLAAAQQRMGDRDVADGSSSAQEAAAARQAARRGQLTGGSSDQYMNHALARCAVFKMEEDKRACMDRVDKGQDSGSVQGGGILREYTYTVPAKP